MFSLQMNLTLLDMVGGGVSFFEFQFYKMTQLRGDFRIKQAEKLKSREMKEG